jgi:hypothetical protein
LAPLLICSSCPALRPCLEESLRSWNYATVEEDERRGPTSTASAVGIWGGSFTEDRWALRHLPARDAADILEASFSERLQTGFAAWTALVRRRPPTSAGRTGSCAGSRRTAPHSCRIAISGLQGEAGKTGSPTRASR